MKKAFSTILLVLAVSISLNVLAENQAEARWQYVGNNKYGVDCFLDTDSVSIRSRSPWSFTCTARAGNSTYYYNYFQSKNQPYFKVSGSNTSYPIRGNRVATSIYNYVVNYY